MPAFYGLIGYPLTHSFSPGFFAEKFSRENIDATYNLYPISQITDFPAVLETYPNIKGLNVTIPYKEAIVPYLDELDPVAKSVGAVNCITFRNRIKKGYNTDVTGFEESIKPLLQLHHKHALILGTGGASKAVAYVLDKLGIAYKNVSRQQKENAFTYSQLTSDVIHAHTVIINTTPLGMYPDVSTYPQLPYDAIGRQHLLYDLIYNPAETNFLQLGKKQGAIIKNGLEMLQLQAEAAWRIWNE